MAHPADKLALRWKNEGEKARQVLKQFKKRAPKNLDEQFEKVHDEVFEKTNCLDCGNCCRTTSPMLFEKDIDRLAKHLRIKTRDFVKDYLFLDTDGIYAFRQTPCPFLGDDKYCSVYSDRPNACREFPHTQQRNILQKLKITQLNTTICPAVAMVVDGLKEKYKI
jgi:Fe-S-cluster containining protein